MKTRRTHLTIAATLLVAAACGGSPEPPPPAAPPARPAQTTTARPTSQDDAARRAREAEEAAARARRELEAQRRATLAEVVYFDYDKAEIRADSRTVLDRKARVLREAPTVRIRVEGHADDRGSTEYNMALGNRRAESVRAYLTGIGVTANRLETVSYGEARPAQAGSNEAAWSRNRRAEFAVVAGVLATD